MTTYRERIKEIAPESDPRHVEAFMRIVHWTFDGLTPQQFKNSVIIASDCVVDAGAEVSERLARSFGL